jgi:hypothetical protein
MVQSNVSLKYAKPLILVKVQLLNNCIATITMVKQCHFHFQKDSVTLLGAI